MIKAKPGWMRVAVTTTLKMCAAIIIAGLAASIAAFALTFMCIPLLIGADMTTSGWLEGLAASIVIIGTVAAFVVSFIETKQPLMAD